MEPQSRKKGRPAAALRSLQTAARYRDSAGSTGSTSPTFGENIKGLVGFAQTDCSLKKNIKAIRRPEQLTMSASDRAKKKRPPRGGPRSRPVKQFCKLA
jgi:hypothetical protein